MKMTVNKTYIGKASPRIRIINSNCDSSTNHQAKGTQKQTGFSLGPCCQNTRKQHHFAFLSFRLHCLAQTHVIFTCYCSSICPASPSSVIWAERMHVESENNFCVSLFSSSTLFWGRVFHSSSWSPEASLYLTETSRGHRCTALHLASTWPRGMNSGGWVFIADSSVCTHSIITLDWSQLAFLDHITLRMLPCPFPT